MITKQDAVNSIHGQLFHWGNCTRTVGPKGGVKTNIKVVRVSGQCKTWVTRPNEFKLPVKYGYYASGYITNDNAFSFHSPDDCSLVIYDEHRHPGYEGLWREPCALCAELQRIEILPQSVMPKEIPHEM